MLQRLLALVGYPAHILNRQLDGLLARVGLRRVPGALVVGVLLGILAATTAGATLAAYEGRPAAQEVPLAQIARGRVVSGLWVAFDAELVDGPHVATVEVSAGGGQAELVERVHYLVADPAEPEFAMVVRFRAPIPPLEAATDPVRIDGTITEDRFNMTSLLDGWGLAERYPDLTFSESRLIAFGFQTPFIEPSWLGAMLLGLVAIVLIVGAFVPQPAFRAGRLTPAAGDLPLRLAVHGALPTPRGEIRLRGTPAQLAWMNVADLARIRWRYWGAQLGDMRGDVEAAVREHGDEERLVVHGPTGSVIWPVADAGPLALQAGDAFLGGRKSPALRVRGDGVDATLTFERVADRDAAAAALTAA